MYNCDEFAILVTMNTGHIEQKAAVLGSKPVMKNTRIGVDLILQKLAAGESVDELLMAYPFITKEQIESCIEYGKEQQQTN
jgi:uncharacterized protein (DUF433 family)